MDDLIKIKHIKGKQNKKKWAKNIDVSNLLEKIEQQNIQQQRNKNQKDLIVQDTITNKIRQNLDPNRFKRPKYIKTQPIIYKKQEQNFIQSQLKDIWSDPSPQTINNNKLMIPAIVKPMSGHSYNTTQQQVKQVQKYIVQTEGRPKNNAKVKKTKQIRKQQIRRIRNKNLRKQQLNLIKLKQTRKFNHQIHSVKAIKQQILKQQKQRQQKHIKKIEYHQKMKEEAQKGKVIQGPRIGKKRYKYQQYLPQAQQLSRPMSKISSNQDLLKDRYDSIFRRGIFEVRNINIHANKKKHIKVKMSYRS